MTGDLSRRRWLAGAVALTGLGGVSTLHAQTRIETRPVAPFKALQWRAAGELVIEQTGREQLSVQAEPGLHARIVTEVRDGMLSIRFAPGRIETRQPIRIRVELKSLESLDAQGSGALHVGPLTVQALSLRLAGSDTLHMARLVARTLDLRIDGSGDVAIDAGQVDHQHVVIAGAADYSASALASRRAEVSIEGSGQMQLAVAEHLQARIDGSGEVLYRGAATVVQSVGGSGLVRHVGA